MKTIKRPRTNRRPCPNYYRTGNIHHLETLWRRHPSFRDDYYAAVENVLKENRREVRLWRERRMGFLERVRQACAQGNEPKARAMLNNLLGTDASDDTKRKAAKCFTLRFNVVAR